MPRAWVVGGYDEEDPRTGLPALRLMIVEVERLGEPVDGMQRVNLRPGCGRSMLIDVLPVAKVYPTLEAAQARLSEVERGGVPASPREEP